MANESGVKNVLSPDRRREMILRRLAGEPREYLADAYGVSVRTVSSEYAKAKEDPEAAAGEARKEYEFRRRVWEMLSE